MQDSNKLDNLPDQTSDVVKSKGTWGGKRENQGRKAGSKNKATQEQLEVKREFIKRVRHNADKLFNAQFSIATGTQMLFMIHTDSKGNRRKPEMVTDAETISKFLDENEGVDGTLGDNDNDYYFMTTSRPDNQAIESLLNRALGKATEKVDITTDGESLNDVKKISDDELDERIRNYLEARTD